MMGNGDGTFNAPSNFTAGDAPVSVAVGDLNGDNKPDLVTANSWSDNISVLMGNSDGTFASRVNYSVGVDPRSVTTADLDGDNKLDLVVANSTSDTVSVMIGNGDGTLNPVVNYNADDRPMSVAVADLDGDNQLDLAVANYSSSNVSVLTGNGDGTFEAGDNYTVGSTPVSIAVDDLNGDNQPDLATANYNSKNVSVLINNARLCSSLSPPAAPTLISPTGTINQATPVYVWESNPCADYYYLIIQNQFQKTIFNQRYSAVTVDNGDGTCSINPGKALSPGDYYWLVRAQNQYGLGPSPAKMAFTVTTAQVPPAAPTLNTPTGTIADTSPAFDWDSVANTDYYYLLIQNKFQKTIYKKRYATATVDNGDGTCSMDPGKVLAAGDYYWLVRAKNQYGLGPASAKMAFAISEGGD